MKYATEHASAKSDVRAAGAPITFTARAARTQGVDGKFVGALADVQVLAYALGTEDGNPREWAELGLLMHEAPRLFVVCDVYGALPPDNARCMWRGVTWTVKSVKPFGPDGTPLFAYVFIAK